jgi:hypothetical protein
VPAFRGQRPSWLGPPAGHALIFEQVRGRVVADRHGTGPAHVTVLRHHVGDTQVVIHRDELDHSEAELLPASRPPAVRRLGLWPAAADGQDKPLPPAARPDLEIFTEQSVEEGEWIAHRYLLRGTHTGDFFGQPPTGAPFEARGLDMVRVRDGQLVEH